MKRTLPLFVALCVFIVMLAFADVYETKNMARPSGTNVVVGVSNQMSLTQGYTNLANGAFVCANATIDFFISFQHRGVAANNDIVILQKSYDGVVWSNLTSIAVAPNNTTLVSLSSNGISIGNYGYVRVSDILNTNNATGITNLTVRWSCKQ